VRVLVSGVGAVGARAARHLVADAAVEAVLIDEPDRKRQAAVVRSLGGRAEAVDDADPTLADLVLLASPPPRHVAAARRAVAAGRHVVSVADSVAAVEDLLDLHAEARERKVTVAVGAGFGPGLSCVLARHAAGEFDAVDEIHVAHQGTGGPACARQHHSALRGVGFDWRDHTWRRRPPGSGRELCFFPDPIGGADCYRAALPDALLLVPAFPGVARVTARLAATRRDRLTAGLPMLRPPHAEGRIGGLRVEVRGRRGSTRDTLVLGAVDRPAVAAGTVAAVTARWVGSGQASGPGAAVSPRAGPGRGAGRGLRGHLRERWCPRPATRR
jgi:Oxidoreductase family, NAD-binding Rossmann fold